MIASRLRFPPFGAGLAVVLGLAPALLPGQPSIGGCPVFPEDHVWNTPVDHLPVHQYSKLYVVTIGMTKVLHPDFGSGYFRTGGLVGIPYTVVAADQPMVPVEFGVPKESDPGPYPVPPNAPIEGGPSHTGDRHVLVLQQGSCKLYELFSAYPQPDQSWKAKAGAVFDLRGYFLRTPYWTSADAAGFAILPGLVRYDEVKSGEIRHALRFTAPRTQGRFVWPARHRASLSTLINDPPMGQRFRLKGGIRLDGFSPETRVILRALQKYGMLLADHGGAWFLNGVGDPRWNNAALRELRRFTGADFEAVDGEALMIDKDSARARQPGRATPPSAKQ